ASAEFKEVINEVVDYVNFLMPNSCENGDPTFQYVVKGLQSAVDKANGRMEEGESVADMKDVLRGTVKFRSPEAMTKAQEFLDARATRLMSFTDIRVGSTQKKDG